VGVLGIRPGGEAGYNIDLSEEAADNDIGVFTTAQAAKLIDDPRESLIDLLDRAL
jgi:hypothetical protein